MATHVAFLRGINLGKRRVKNEELRRCFEDHGLEDVATFLASGNVAFRYGSSNLSALEGGLEARLQDTLGYEVKTFVRPLAALADLSVLPAIAEAAGDGFNAHVMFLAAPLAKAARAGLEAIESSDDRFHGLGREVIWFRRGNLSDSEIKARDLDRALAKAPHTMRNLNTVRRLVAKFS